MNTLTDMNQDEEWKKRLRETFITLMSGSELEEQHLYANKPASFLKSA